MEKLAVYLVTVEFADHAPRVHYVRAGDSNLAARACIKHYSRHHPKLWNAVQGTHVLSTLNPEHCIPRDDIIEAGEPRTTSSPKLNPFKLV